MAKNRDYAEFTVHLYPKTCCFQQICPNCGKTAKGIDEMMVLFGFERTENGLQPLVLCKECREKLENTIW